MTEDLLLSENSEVEKFLPGRPEGEETKTSKYVGATDEDEIRRMFSLFVCGYSSSSSGWRYGMNGNSDSCRQPN